MKRRREYQSFALKERAGSSSLTSELELDSLRTSSAQSFSTFFSSKDEQVSRYKTTMTFNRAGTHASFRGSQRVANGVLCSGKTRRDILDGIPHQLNAGLEKVYPKPDSEAVGAELDSRGGFARRSLRRSIRRSLKPLACLLPGGRSFGQRRRTETTATEPCRNTVVWRIPDAENRVLPNEETRLPESQEEAKGRELARDEATAVLLETLESLIVQCYVEFNKTFPKRKPSAPEWAEFSFEKL